MPWCLLAASYEPSEFVQAFLLDSDFLLLHFHLPVAVVAVVAAVAAAVGPFAALELQPQPPAAFASRPWPP